MKDMLIIGGFVAARLFHSVQSFATRFLEETQAQIILNIIFVLIVIAVWLHTTSKNKKSLNQTSTQNHDPRQYFIGLRRITMTDTFIGLSIGLVLLGINTLPSLLGFSPTLDIPISRSSFFWGMLLIMFAALSEELFYRSYIISQLQRMKLKVPLTLLFSALLFALGHLPYGAKGIIFAFSAGMVLSLFMILRKSLWANTIAHCSYNIIVYSFAFSAA